MSGLWRCLIRWWSSPITPTHLKQCGDCRFVWEVIGNAVSDNSFASSEWCPRCRERKQKRIADHQARLREEYDKQKASR